MGSSTHTSEGNPRVSHSANDPCNMDHRCVWFNYQRLRGNTIDEAVALGAGLSAGTGAGTM